MRATTELRLDVFNDLGQKVWSGTLQANASADIRELAKGIYFVIAVASEKENVYKVVVME